MSARKLLSFIARLLVTAGAIWLAFSHVPISDILPMLTRLPIALVLAALVCLHVAQYISALRTRFYLHHAGIDLPVKPSLLLQYVGGLFNALLPGGTGGDVYKAWWLKRYKAGRMLNMVALMIGARLNGLWSLGVLVCMFALASAPIRGIYPNMELLVLLVMLCGTLCYQLLAYKILKEPFARQYRAGVYSFGVQIMLALCAFCICIGLGMGAHAFEYLILFLLSCVLAMLPISIGGIGIRELAVLHGSTWLGLDEQNGVALAFGFTVLNLTVPLVGAFIYSAWRPQHPELVHGE